MIKDIHYGWLDGVRGMAAIYVTCHHAIMQVTISGNHANDIAYRLMQLFFSFGHYAVDVFIVLSGYSLMLPVIAKNSFGKISLFYWRRTIRIFLPYLAALFITLLLIYYFGLNAHDGTHWAEVSLPVTQSSILQHFFLIHQWDTDSAKKINPAFWSVGVEYQIYFLFPIFYYLAERFGYRKIFVLLSVACYLIWALCMHYNTLNPGPNGSSIYYCSLFFMGMSAAKFSFNSSDSLLLSTISKHRYKFFILSACGILLNASISFSLSRYELSNYFPLQIQSFFVGLFAALFMYVYGKYRFQFNVRSKIFNMFTYFFQWVGKMGFSVYLLHFPIIALVWKNAVLPYNIRFYWLQSIMILILGLLLSIIVSIYFHKFVELPCHQLSRSFKK